MAAWRESEQLAAQILTGQVPLRNATGGAPTSMPSRCRPDWADTMDKTTQIGNHIFYRGARTRARRSARLEIQSDIQVGARCA